MTDNTPSSSPCALTATDPAYHGLLTRDALRDALLGMLHVERACVRICELSEPDAKGDRQMERFRALRNAGLASCEGLMHALRSIGVRPDERVSEFLEHGMATEDVAMRLQLVKQTRERMLETIVTLLPKISQEPVLRQLVAIRSACPPVHSASRSSPTSSPGAGTSAG